MSPTALDSSPLRRREPCCQFKGTSRNTPTTNAPLPHSPLPQHFSGDDVCGYPRIVHGGLTAAIVDEAVGHLFYALRCANALPFRGPAFTVNLNINYKRKIAAGRVLLVTARVVECGGRKLKAVATVCDGPGEDAVVFATGTALFVAPTTGRLLKEGLRYAASYVAPKWVSLDG